MREVRAAIDALDDGILDLLARRVGYVERAAELKPAEGLTARAPERKREVLERVASGAEARGVPGDLATQLWSLLIAWGVAHETRLIAAAQLRVGADDEDIRSRLVAAPQRPI